MSDLNVSSIVGRVSQDAILRTTPNGAKYCLFGIAVNRSHKKDDNTWEELPHFFNLSLYGARAEGLIAYLVKGQLVSIQGHLVQDRWESNGVKHSRMSLGIDDLRLLGPAPDKKKADATGEVDAALALEFDDIEVDPDLDLDTDLTREGEVMA
jgi:single-strand DNA-binding protein